MDFDEKLQAAWQGESRHATRENLTARVQRQRRRLRFWRGCEIALSLLAVLLFGHALVSWNLKPAHWLLLPFFAVFLPCIWILTLRAPRRRSEDVAENGSTYARLRLSQLRTSLRDLWLARRAAMLLVAYAIVANALVWLAGERDWRPAALTLLIYALVWAAGTHGFGRRLRRARLREYRAVRRLADG